MVLRLLVVRRSVGGNIDRDVDVALRPRAFHRQVSLIDRRAEGIFGNLPYLAAGIGRRRLTQLLADRVEIEGREPAVLLAALRRGARIQNFEPVLLQLHLVVPHDFERGTVRRANVENARGPSFDALTLRRLECGLSRLEPCEGAKRDDELVELAEVVSDDDRPGVARHHRVILAALHVRELGKRLGRRERGHQDGSRAGAGRRSITSRRRARHQARVARSGERQLRRQTLIASGDERVIVPSFSSCAARNALHRERPAQKGRSPVQELRRRRDPTTTAEMSRSKVPSGRGGDEIPRKTASVTSVTGPVCALRSHDREPEHMFGFIEVAGSSHRVSPVTAVPPPNTAVSMPD